MSDKMPASREQASPSQPSSSGRSPSSIDAQLQASAVKVANAKRELQRAVAERHTLIRRALAQPDANGAHIGRQASVTRAAVAKIGKSSPR